MSIHDVHHSAVIIAAGMVSNESDDNGCWSNDKASTDILVGKAYRIADALEKEKNTRLIDEEYSRPDRDPIIGII